MNVPVVGVHLPVRRLGGHSLSSQEQCQAGKRSHHAPWDDAGGSEVPAREAEALVLRGPR